MPAFEGIRAWALGSAQYYGCCVAFALRSPNSRSKLKLSFPVNVERFNYHAAVQISTLALSYVYPPLHAHAQKVLSRPAPFICDTGSSQLELQSSTSLIRDQPIPSRYNHKPFPLPSASLGRAWRPIFALLSSLQSIEQQPPVVSSLSS